MNSKIELTNQSKIKTIPKRQHFHRWVETTLNSQHVCGTISIYIVDEEEARALNLQYRQKNYATNVLSFPLTDEEVPQLKNKFPLLGELIICAPVVKREAEEQIKSLEAHWAHLIIHGTLHILGYDHIQNDDAEIMEAIEIKLMQQLNYPNPYLEYSEHTEEITHD